jgi:hypothetical protein
MIAPGIGEAIGSSEESDRVSHMIIYIINTP